LKEKILTGELEAGQRVSVDSLASEIGVSRTPIRDALNRLSLEGLVVVTPRRGTVVGGLSVEDINEVYQARYLIEPAICESIAATASGEFVRDLENIQAEWETVNASLIYKDIKETTRYVELNNAFHLRIVEETGNSRLVQIHTQLYMQPRMGSLVLRDNYQGPLSRMAEHRVVIEAFRQNDPEGAMNAMKEHLSQSRINLTTFLREPVTGNRSPLGS
jgi:DNA-binding GntR family transcriptional regulator